MYILTQNILHISQVFFQMVIKHNCNTYVQIAYIHMYVCVRVCNVYNV